MPHAAPYPLLFEPMLFAKVWGGDSLARVGKSVKPGEKIGESWELADLAATSASGAGGGSARSVIRNGELSGKPLHQAVGAWGPQLMGDVVPTASGGFPLLIKFLDARENLSVQVHPSPAYCRMHPHAHLKTECWYILSAEKDAKIYKGVKPGVTKIDFADALTEDNGAAVIDLLEAVDAVPGECHNLPSGTVHALGAGVLVAEVQTPSDTTFRVYDWGRTGRELHIEQSLMCIQWEQARDATKFKPGAPSTRLVTTGYFDLDEFQPARGTTSSLALDSAAAKRPLVLMLVRGSGELRSTTSAFSPKPLHPGDTTLIPASLAPHIEFAAATDATLLRASPR